MFFFFKTVNKELQVKRVWQFLVHPAPLKILRVCSLLVSCLVAFIMIRTLIYILSKVISDDLSFYPAKSPFIKEFKFSR